jgi:hypothetical protein
MYRAASVTVMHREKENAKQKCVATAVLGAALVTIPSLVYAQIADIGKREYVNSCAVCHGDSGRGDGPLVKSLKIAPTDLAGLQKSNNGVFPIGRDYEVIDGRETIGAHGSRDIPVWGDRFKEKSTEQTELALRFGISIDAEARDRILALIRYLSSDVFAGERRIGRIMWTRAAFTDRRHLLDLVAMYWRAADQLASPPFL